MSINCVVITKKDRVLQKQLNVSEGAFENAKSLWSNLYDKSPTDSYYKEFFKLESNNFYKDKDSQKQSHEAWEVLNKDIIYNKDEALKKYNGSVKVFNADYVKMYETATPNEYKVSIAEPIYSPKDYKDVYKDVKYQLNKDDSLEKEEIIASEKTIRDLAARMADRIGLDVKFESDRTLDYKGKLEGGTAIINLAHASLDTPIHEILGHPIIRAIKTGEGVKPFPVSSSKLQDLYPDIYKFEGTEKESFDVNFEKDETKAKEQYLKDHPKETREYNDGGDGFSQLYNNLVKEIHSTERGRKVLDRIKRDYVYKDVSKKEVTYAESQEEANELESQGYEYSGRTEDGAPEYTRIPKYTLEEQEEEALVELLGLYAAGKLDNTKDGKMISLLKRLLKEMKSFMRSIIKQKEVNIDSLPDNMTIGDLSDLLAYSNSKLILPGNEVKYTTPDNKTFKTYQEANNHISKLTKIKKADLNKTSPTLDRYAILGEHGEEWAVFDTKHEAEQELYALDLYDYHIAKADNPLDQFISKNKEYEQSKEVIDEWKKVNKIKYNPEEVYSRGQGFYSVVGAYSDFDVKLMFQNLLAHIEDSNKAGGKFTISAFTKPVNKRISHLEGGGGKIKFKITPKSNDIEWASNIDVYSGSVWDASTKVNKDTKSELLGVSYTKTPSMRSLPSVQPNLASIIDNLQHHHNELGINLTGENFRLEYDEDIPYSTKKILDNVNKILDQKFGKFNEPKISNEKIKPTQTENILKESLDEVKNRTISGKYYIYSDVFKDPKVFDDSAEAWAFYNENISDFSVDTPVFVEDESKKDYDSQAKINVKIDALKKGARKFPRTLIRSEVVKSKAAMPSVTVADMFEDDDDLPFQKVQSQFNALSPEELDQAESEFGTKPISQEKAKQTELDKEVDRLHNSGILSVVEIDSLASNAVYGFTYVVSQLQGDKAMSEAYFGSDYEDVDFTTKSRADIINTIGIAKLFHDAVKTTFFNSDRLEDADFDTLDKLDHCNENFNALVGSAYHKLMKLEDLKIKGATLEQILSEYTPIADTQDNEGTIEGSDMESWQVSFRNQSAASGLSTLVRRKFSLLQQTDSEGNVIMDDFGFPKYVDSDLAVNSILNWSVGVTTVEEIGDILAERAIDNPWVDSVIEQVKEEPFRSQFFKNFRKDFTKYSIVRVEEDEFSGAKSYTTEIINTKSASATLLNNIKTAFYQDEIPQIIKNGKINVAEVTKLKEEVDSIYKDLKTSFRNKDTFAKSVEKNAPKLTSLLNDIGILADNKMLTAATRKDLTKSSFANTNLGKMKVDLSYMMNALLQSKDEVDVDPLSKDNKNEVFGNYRNLINLLAPHIQESIESSTFEGGKMYYSFTDPSHLGKLIHNIKDTLDNKDKYDKFMEDNYSSFRFFKETPELDNNDDWNNEWLRLLNSSKANRDAFDIKLQLHFDKTGYTDLGELGYTMSLMSEFFSDRTKKWAWYRLPILSNKPASEFIKFKRYSGAKYKNEIKDGLIKTYSQELMRIKTVLEITANPNIQKIKSMDIAEKVSKGNPDIINKIKNGNNITAKELLKIGKDSGAEFKFLEFLNANIKNQDDLGKLILDSINNKEVDEGALVYLLEGAIDEHMGINLPETIEGIINSDSQSQLATEMRVWGKAGLFEKNDNGDFVNQGLIGKDDWSIIDNLQQYLWNDMFATTNIIQLTVTDLAYYKNVEDFQKRYAQVYSPAMGMNVTARDVNGELYSKDGKERTIYLKDLEVFSDIADNVKVALYNKVTDGVLSQYQADVILAKYGYSNHMDKSGNKFVKTSLNNKNILLRSEKINVTDAQGYSSPTSYRKKLSMMGEWDNAMEEAYNRIKSGDYNIKDLNVTWQPLKPFVYSQVRKSTGAKTMVERKVPVQNKNSEYLILMADAIIRGDKKSSKIGAIYDFMEKSADRHKGLGIDTVQFESAVKSGLAGVIDINNIESRDEIVAELDKYTYDSQDALDPYSDQFVHTIPFEDYGKQQEVPPHLIDHEQLHGSQIRILGISDITPGTVFNINGEPMAAEDVISEYQELIADNIDESLEKLLKDFKTDGTKAEKDAAISELLKEAILEDQKYGPDLLRACSLNKDGEFTIPLSDPIHSNRIEQLLNSIIKSRINKQKIQGGPVVQATVYGISDSLNIIWQDSKGNILKTKQEFTNKPVKGYATYEKYLEDNQNSVAYFETYMTIPSQELRDILTQDDGTLMPLDEAIKQGLVPESVKDAVGYRIPTEDKYSMAPMRVKDFLPNEGGEVVMLPPEITLLSGSDFDVDKLYVMLKSYQKKIVKGKDTLIESQEPKAKRNNRLIELQLGILTNSDTTSKMFNPGSFDTQKRSAKIINIAKDPSNSYSYSQLQAMTLEELEDLDTSGVKRNIIYPSTQVYFHKQNMTAGGLIGVFANNNTSHAFLSLQNINLNLTESSEFSFDGVNVAKHTDVKLDAIKAKDGSLISKTIASFLAASVDAVKDPVLNFMNLNNFTTGPAMVLARLGFDSDSIGLLTTQPIIEELTAEYLKRNNEGFTSVEDLVNEYLDKRAGELGVPLKSFEQNLINNKFNKEDLLKNLNPNNYDKQFQLETLLLFSRLNKISQEVGLLTFLTKFNSMTNAVGPTIADNLVLRERYNKYKDKFSDGNQSLFNDEAEFVLENSPILDAMFEATISDRGAAYQIFKDDFLHYADKTKDILGQLRNQVKTPLDAKLINRVVNDFALFKLTAGDNPVLDNSYENRDYFINKFPTEFRNKLAEMDDNTLKKGLAFRGADKKLPIATLDMSAGKLSSTAKEQLKVDWGQMITTENTKQDAIDIFNYNLRRAGFNYSPKTITHLASTDVKLNIPNYVESLRGIANDDNLMANEFIDQFKRNYYKQAKIVPNIKSKDVAIRKVRKKIFIDVKENGSKVDAIITKIGKRKKPVEMFTIDDKLYRKIDYSSDIIIAEEITPLGASNNVLEYNANESSRNMKSAVPKDFQKVIAKEEDKKQSPPTMQDETLPPQENEANHNNDLGELNDLDYLQEFVLSEDEVGAIASMINEGASETILENALSKILDEYIKDPDLKASVRNNVERINKKLC